MPQFDCCFCKLLSSNCGTYRAFGVSILPLQSTAWLPAMVSTDQSSLSWCLVALIAFALLLVLSSYRRLTQQLIPTLSVSLTNGNDHAAALTATVSHSAPPQPFHPGEAQDPSKTSKYTPTGSVYDGKIPCYDPGNMQLLGHLPAMDSGQASIVVMVVAQWRCATVQLL